MGEVVGRVGVLGVFEVVGNIQSRSLQIGDSEVHVTTSTAARLVVVALWDNSPTLEPGMLLDYRPLFFTLVLNNVNILEVHNECYYIPIILFSYSLLLSDVARL